MKSSAKLLSALTVLVLLVSACAPAAVPTPQTIEVTRVVEVPKIVEATKVVETTKIVEVTPVPVKEVIVRTTNAAMANDPVQLARQKYLIETFRALQPSIIIDSSPYQYEAQTFAARLAAGTLEDTFLTAFTEPQKLIQNKQVADITDLIKDLPFVKDYKPEFLNLAKDKDGKVYGLPVYANVLGLMYRRDVFEKAGLDANKPPQTWDELKGYCKTLKEKLPEIACFAIRNPGDLAGWMSFAMQASFGQDANEVEKDGKWTATFNNASMVKAMTLWKELYDAGYMPSSLSWGNIEQVQDFSVAKVAMTIADGGTLQWMVNNMGSFDGVEKFDLKDVGLGRLPDGGGNGSLGGGNVWLYNAKSTPDALKGAVAWNAWRDFDLAAYEQDLKIRQDAGALIGYPEVQIFGGDYGKQRSAILAKYSNAPTENYENYNASPVNVMAEPPLEAGKMKVALGEVLQKILTTPNADVQAILDQAVKTFQTTVLDAQK